MLIGYWFGTTTHLVPITGLMSLLEGPFFLLHANWGINYTNQTISTFHINLHINSLELLSGLLHEKDMRDFKGHKVINGSSLGTWASIYPSPNNKIKPWINPVPYSLGNERAPCMIVSGYDQHRFPNMRLMIWTNVSNVIAERPLKAQQCWLHCWV